MLKLNFLEIISKIHLTEREIFFENLNDISFVTGAASKEKQNVWIFGTLAHWENWKN